MPANKYALLRYRIIDKCIRNKYKPFPSKEDLRKACEENLYGSDGERISDSTIEKDLYAMRNEIELGYEAPIKFSKADKGYFYEDPDFTINEIPLNDDDLDAIKFAANTLYQFKDIALFQQFEFAIEKIFGRLNISPNVQDEAISKYVQFETVPEVKGAELLGDLLNAIKQQLTVRITYEAFTRKAPTIHALDPYLLKEYRNRWYLIGYSHDKAKVITFALDRINHLAVTDEHFKLTEGFDPDTFFKYSIGITQGADAPQKVVLKFAPGEGKYVKTQPLHQSQQVLADDANEFRISINVVVTYELISTILGYGDGVEVVEPASLRKDVASRMKNALIGYSGS